MKISKWDAAFLGIIATVIAIFVSISGEEKTRSVPNNATHRIVYDTAYRNAPGKDSSFGQRLLFKADKKGAEVYCEPCHQRQNIAFPPNHPPKNRCLLCHKLQKLGS